MFKDLSKDLLDAASSVLDQSARLRRENYRKLVAKGLKHFNVSSFGELSEQEQRQFSEWVAERLDGECACGEQDDDQFHLYGKVNAHSGVPTMGEESSCSDEEKESTEDLVEDDEEEVSLEEDDMPDDAVYHKDGDVDGEKKRDLSEEYASPEPSSAIGHRSSVELPKHADVIKDLGTYDGSVGYRLLIQYVNGRPKIFPDVSLPAAPSPEALVELIASLEDPNGVLSASLATFLDVPAERPEHKGS